VTTALSGPAVLAVPLLILVFAVLAWVTWSHPASPPRRGRGYAVRQGWQIDPMAVLNRDLREGRIGSGIVAVRDRLLLELSEQHHLSAEDVRRRFFLLRPRPAPVIARSCRTVRALETTFEIAFRAEDPRRTDLWTRWRRPVWRERARQRFEEELSEVETLWPRLEGPS